MTESPLEGERVVVIDDDYAMRLSCRQILAKSGFEVETYEDGAQGLAAVARWKPSLVVVDLKMPGLSGMDVIHRVREIDPDTVLIVITGYATIGTAVEAMQSGAYDFLPKPFKPDELRVIVHRALDHRRLQRRSRELEVERELMKRRFVSFITHQLKSPLAAIHQYLDVLRRLEDQPDVAEKRQQWLERCLARTEDLRKLIDDWLTLAQTEGGTLVHTRERVDLRPVVTDLLTSYEEPARAADVTLGCALGEGEYAVLADRNCVLVVFDNLVSNAIAYNRPGGTVEVSARSAAGEVVVEVRDTGIGIPEDARELLFEEFFRVPGRGGNGSGRARAPGTGLGLAICKRILAELGGVIEVESELEVGSTFRVRLPVYRGAAPTGDPDKGSSA